MTAAAAGRAVYEALRLAIAIQMFVLIEPELSRRFSDIAGLPSLLGTVISASVTVVAFWIINPGTTITVVMTEYARQTVVSGPDSDLGEVSENSDSIKRCDVWIDGHSVGLLGKSILRAALRCGLTLEIGFGPLVINIANGDGTPISKVIDNQVHTIGYEHAFTSMPPSRNWAWTDLAIGTREFQPEQWVDLVYKIKFSRRRWGVIFWPFIRVRPVVKRFHLSRS
jgi:hypothetical protein